MAATAARGLCSRPFAASPARVLAPRRPLAPALKVGARAMRAVSTGAPATLAARGPWRTLRAPMQLFGPLARAGRVA
jgi:hypothetical protein